MHADSKPSPDDLAIAAEIFRLLADPTRVGLLQALATGEELSVGALAEHVAKRPSGVSQHLAKLRMGHLVSTRRDGTSVHYRLANEHVGRLVVDALRHVEHLGPGTPAHHRPDPGLSSRLSSRPSPGTGPSGPGRDDPGPVPATWPV